MIPDFIKPYLAIAAAILLTVVATYATYIYKDRQRLQAEMGRIEDQIERNKKQAQALLTQREKENADLAEKWRNYARKSDDEYEQKIATLRRAGAVGVREFTGCGASSELAGSSKTASADTPAKPAAESGTGPAVRELVLTEGAVGQVLQWYAYGQSCYAFVNSK